jgi:peptidoglycan hydrolase-like protein with peptidoglycan-binding domain
LQWDLPVRASLSFNNFLRAILVYPEGKITGYYGALTQAAVQRFQAKNSIVSSGSPSTTGYGRVGSQTAAAIQAACGSGGIATGAGTGGAVNQGQVGGFIQVSPVSGAGPLQVNIEATVNTTNACGAGLYTIDYGDGSQTEQINVPAGSCQSLQQTYTHTYSASGTYLVTLAAGDHKSSATVVVQ